jgi:hypothetical protein
LRKAIPAILEDPEVKRQIDDFKEWAEQCGHSKWVILPSLRRALAPLVAHAATGGVFPGWEDFSVRERRQFILHSLMREKIALGPVAAHLRAMQRFPNTRAIRLLASRQGEAQPVAVSNAQPDRERCQECEQLYLVRGNRPTACPHCGAVRQLTHLARNGPKA